MTALAYRLHAWLVNRLFRKDDLETGLFILLVLTRWYLHRQQQKQLVCYHTEEAGPYPYPEGEEP